MDTAYHGRGKSKRARDWGAEQNLGPTGTALSLMHHFTNYFLLAEVVPQAARFRCTIPRTC